MIVRHEVITVVGFIKRQHNGVVQCNNAAAAAVIINNCWKL